MKPATVPAAAPRPAPVAAKPPATPPAPSAPAGRRPISAALAGVAGAQVRTQGQYLTEGQYVLEIRNVKEGQTRAPKCRPFFVVEGKVLESAGAATPTSKPLPVGSSFSWMAMLDTDLGPGDVKGFLCAAVPGAEDDVEGALGDVLNGSLQGVTVCAVAVTVPTKSGTLFTRVEWSLPE